MKTKDAPTATPAADVYFELVRRFPLRPIRTAAEHAAATDVTRRLMLRPEGRKRPAGERDYLQVLVGLVADYERRTAPPAATTANQRLRHVVDESGTSQAALAAILGLSQPAISLILGGKRNLTVDALKRLAGHFRLDMGYFA